MKSFTSINPYTEKELTAYETVSDTQLEDILAHADTAQRKWKKVPVEERAALFNKLAELIKQHVDRLAGLATLEMGKTFAEGKAEVLKCARGCEYYAAHAARFLQPEITAIENNREVHVLHEAMGVVLGIFPWNFPYWQIVRSATPVVIAGNAMLVKPAPSVPQCALALQELFDQAGFPAGVIQTVFANEAQISHIIADPRIRACTLTGSEKAGSIVASAAAKHIKKSVLELGGSDPFIVLDDADLDLVMGSAITARFQNNGQSCIAAKRYIVSKNIADAFLERLVKEVSKLKMGDPRDASVNIGPLARKDLKEKLEEQVQQTLAKGAKLLYAQQDIPSQGFFYPPTILAEIPEDSPGYQEELFGPVLSLYIVNSDEEAVHLANDTSFGLGASVWSADIQRAKNLAAEIQSGNVFVNNMVKSDPRFPFGGVKSSGFGRELGEYGLREFCNIKTMML